MQPAALATRQHLGRDLERVQAKVPQHRGSVAEIDAGQRDAVRNRSRTSPPSVSGSGCGSKTGIAEFAGSGPKYRTTQARACSRSTSPTIESTALFGA